MPELTTLNEPNNTKHWAIQWICLLEVMSEQLVVASGAKYVLVVASGAKYVLVVASGAKCLLVS